MSILVDMRKVIFYILGTLLTGTLLFVGLVVFSALLGWGNLYLALAFWALCVPIIAYTSSQIIRQNNLLLNAIAGTILFYGFMYFMIYKLSGTDFFVIMKYSFGSTLILLIGYYHYSRLLNKFFTSKSRS